MLLWNRGIRQFRNLFYFYLTMTWIMPKNFWGLWKRKKIQKESRYLEDNNFGIKF